MYKNCLIGGGAERLELLAERADPPGDVGVMVKAAGGGRGSDLCRPEWSRVLGAWLLSLAGLGDFLARVIEATESRMFGVDQES